jgi:hypothetical protein
MSHQFNDSITFRSGMRLMRQRIGEKLRQRRAVIENIHFGHRNPAHKALAEELSLLIRAVDAMPLDVDADS